ncbi:HD family phosphohydrolase [Thermoproteota archaeon]
MYSGLTFLTKIPIKFVYAILAFLGLVGISLLVYSPYLPINISLKVGDIAQETVVSPKFIEFESSLDKLKTQHEIEKRISQVKQVYTIDEAVNKQIKSDILSFFKGLKDYKEAREKDALVMVPDELSFLSTKILDSDSALKALISPTVEYFAIQNTEKILYQGLQEVATKDIRQRVLENIKMLNMKQSEENFIASVVHHFMKPNLVYNETKTKELIQENIKAVTPFKTTLKEGEPIIYKGDTVTQSHIDALRALNLYGVKANIQKFFGIFLVSLLLFLLLERFLYYFHHELHVQIKYFVLMFIVILLVVVIARLLIQVELLPAAINLQFLIPIPIAAIILTSLVSPNLALLCGTLISVFVALMHPGDPFIFFYLFLFNCAALFAIYKKYTRTEFIVSGYIIGAFNVFMVMVLGLFYEQKEIIWFVVNMLMAFLNGVVSAMIALAVLPYLESIFKITTYQRLLELSNLYHPLLKRLMITAPGTYQHSLMVANLAEAAAEAIQANPLLARVGAYFHDIGKLKRPIFFSENQISEENPHTTLSARMSKLVISSHVKDGLELAKKYKLPDILLDFIAEHHGTSLVSFFYSKALATEELKDSETAKEAFRYPGPKPSYKESGIVMLADSVEAAIRSLEKPSPNKIENLIERIFKEKIADKQLDSCPLSLKEIDIIRETFLNSFQSIYHSRLDYKEELENIIQQTKNKLPQRNNGKS